NGHGPRADRQAGYISATTASHANISLANSSRYIHMGSLPTFAACAPKPLLFFHHVKVGTAGQSDVPEPQ
ncbi:MAG: hypothetical protein ABJP82_14665, partial [Hyphomicrobiales bacterium]